MPTFPKAPTTQLTLPTTANLPEDQRAWVKVRTTILLGDIAAARAEGNGNIFQTGLAMLARLITEWNYTDEDGTPAPINRDTLNKIEKADYEFLDAWINEHLPAQQEGLAVEEKKGSTSTSIPVLTESDQPSTPLTTS